MEEGAKYQLALAAAPMTPASLDVEESFRALHLSRE